MSMPRQVINGDQRDPEGEGDPVAGGHTSSEETHGGGGEKDR